MNEFLPILDHLASIATLLTFPAALIATIAWVSGMSKTHKMIITTIFGTIAFAAYAVDVSDRFFIEHKGVARPQYILSWSFDGKAFIVIVDSAKLGGVKDKDMLMLVIRNQYADRDRLADTHIEKSQPYTITGEPLVMAVVPSSQFVVTANATNNIEYTLASIPYNIAPASITTIGDVQKLGGKILDTTAAGIFFSLPSAVPPLAAPIPESQAALQHGAPPANQLPTGTITKKSK